MKFKFAAKTELEKLGLFLETGGHKILFYHSDADGICSAALFLKFFHDFDARPRGGPIIDDDFVREMEIEKPDVLVFLDLPVDQGWKKIRKLMNILPNLKIIIIDHHLFEKNINSKQILHINPMFKKDDYIPASAVVYQVIKDMKKPIKPYIWISCIGIIGDYGFETMYCKGIFKECERIYPGLIEEPIQKSKLAGGAEIISAATAVRGFAGAERVLEALVQSRVYKDFSSNKTFEKWHLLAKREFEKTLKRAEAKKEVIGKVIFFPLKAKFSIYSDIGTRLGETYSDMIVVTIRDLENGLYKLGLRAQSGKYNLGKILKKCVKGIGNGGGHPKAAGAVVNDLEKFKKRFLKEVNKK